jgi:hypothetical protein
VNFGGGILRNRLIFRSGARIFIIYLKNVWKMVKMEVVLYEDFDIAKITGNDRPPFDEQVSLMRGGGELDIFGDEKRLKFYGERIKIQNGM